MPREEYILQKNQCRCAESNRRPFDYESTALPTELQRLMKSILQFWDVAILVFDEIINGIMKLDSDF